MTWHQELLTAVLAGPPGTVASHRSAARLHRLRGIDADLIEVTSRRWKREHQTRFIVHESLRHSSTDTTQIDGIAVTKLARTFVDLGAVLRPGPLGRALDEARRKGLIDLDAVVRCIDQRSVQGRDGIRTIRAVVEERSRRPLTDSTLEDLLVDVLIRHRLPMPETQWQVTDGRQTAFLDFAYPDARLAIEIDSEQYHLDLHTFHTDRARQNWLSVLGWTFLRFTAHHLRRDAFNVARQIAAALQSGI